MKSARSPAAEIEYDRLWRSVAMAAPRVDDVGGDADLSLTEFKEAVWRGYLRAPHLDALDHFLMRALRWRQTDGREGIQNLHVSMPPRYGKTSSLQHFAALSFGLNPDMRQLAVGYGGDLADKTGRAVRNMIDMPEYGDLFPSVTVDPRSSAARSWDIYRHKGGMDSRGILAGVTGLGANILILDDLIKNREEAESALQRGKIYDELRASVMTRKQPPSRTVPTIIIGTRWHVDDPIGRLLREQDGKWHSFVLPAIITEPQEVYDDLGRLIYRREPEEPLWEYMHSLEELYELEKEMHPYEWQALYQQTPILAAGAIFRREWFEILRADMIPTITRACRFWDLAMSDKTSADFTASVLMGEGTDGHYYVLDVKRERKDWGEVVSWIGEIARGDGPEVAIGIEQAGYMGSRAVDELNADPRMHGYAVRPYPVHTDKVTRALPAATKFHSRLIHLREGGWNAAYIDELVAFEGKSSVHDDQVDATSGAWYMMGDIGGWGVSSWDNGNQQHFEELSGLFDF